jgi:hypothetical protein
MGGGSCNKTAASRLFRSESLPRDGGLRQRTSEGNRDVVYLQHPTNLAESRNTGGPGVGSLVRFSLQDSWSHHLDSFSPPH